MQRFQADEARMSRGRATAIPSDTPPGNGAQAGDGRQPDRRSGKADGANDGAGVLVYAEQVMRRPTPHTGMIAGRQAPVQLQPEVSPQVSHL